MVTVVRTEERDTATHTEMSANNTFRTGEPMILDRDSESLFDQGKPRTVEDLAMLFNLGRAFSRGSRVAELVAPLAQCLRERFNPEAYWVILRQEEEESPAIYPVDEAGAFTSNRGLAEIVHQVLQEPKGMLLPERWTHDGMMGIRTTLVAPMALGKEVVGVIVAQADTPKLIFDDTDLEFLLAVAHAAGTLLEGRGAPGTVGAGESAAVVRHAERGTDPRHGTRHHPGAIPGPDERAVRSQCADSRRDRHGQRTGGPDDSRPQRTRGETAHHRELRGHSRRTLRERVVRA